MRFPISISRLATGLTLGLLLACGGGGGGQGGGTTPVGPATGLAYQDPVGSGWRLTRSAASTTTHLVLDLRPPAAVGSGRGAGLTLQVDETKAAWAKVQAADAFYLRPGPGVALGSGSPALFGEPKGGSLALGAFQKGRGAAPGYGGQPVLSVAVDFKAAANLQPGVVIPLGVLKALHLPASGAAESLAGQVQVGVLSTK